MKTRAAVAFEKAKPLVVAEVNLDGPKAGEVLVDLERVLGNLASVGRWLEAVLRRGAVAPSALGQGPVEVLARRRAALGLAVAQQDQPLHPRLRSLYVALGPSTVHRSSRGCREGRSG